MKTFFILFALTMLTSCNDAQRNRIRSSNALTVDDGEYKAQYIAEVNVVTSVGKTSLSFVHSEYSQDADTNYNCKLKISAGTQFSYIIKNNQLTLQNEFTNLIFTKTDRLTTDGLVGTWTMKQAETSKVDTVTEMEFSDLNEVRINKVCNLKK